MKLFVKNVKGLVIPSQAKEGDAAYDIIATSPPIIVGTKIQRPMDGMDLWSKIDYIEYRTGLFIEPMEDFHTLLLARSSISKTNLILANGIGLVDSDYRGELICRFKYITQPEDFVILNEGGGTRIYCIINQDAIYQQGQKIIQIKPSPNIPITFEVVEKLGETTRGSGGFGSSDAKQV